MIKNSVLIALAALVAPLLTAAYTAPAEARPVYVDSDIVDAAVSGYDVVSYFRADGVPQKGNEHYKVQHEGVTYLFASAENAEAFKSAPASFSPQYGGHCAWAMSRGSLAPGDPKLYKIVDGKLYLNFNPQVQQTWLKDVSGFVNKADAEWQEIPDDAEFGG
jgi:YHS domain-containing protein